MRRLGAIIFDFDGVIADCRIGALLPGAADFVRAAAGLVPIGIASGAHTREIESLLHDNGLDGIVTAVVGVEQTRRSKPSPDPYLEALHRIGAAAERLDPRDVVAIDDSLCGLVSAGTAGLCCVGVAATPDRRHELSPHARLIVPGLHALTLDSLDTLIRTT